MPGAAAFPELLENRGARLARGHGRMIAARASLAGKPSETLRRLDTRSTLPPSLTRVAFRAAWRFFVFGRILR
jgi:hypothetical protein